ncbi:conserved protein of unknown function [Pseudomonas marincola]|uniref:Uncharacterized protein n=1 Tax=Pseudomonas marincola TaxID=437900 RepID=A0A653E1V1_9PSED|nr:conserved protein of unknown function [Pseudomonas marincola]
MQLKSAQLSADSQSTQPTILTVMRQSCSLGDYYSAQVQPIKL